jgi:AcrR family transcriptional regulator
MATKGTAAKAPRRRMTAAQRRERILDVAGTLFAERGYTGASIDRIAEGAGVSAPVVYDHFRSKEELFIAVMQSARDELTSRGAEVMGRNAPLEDRVREAIDTFFAYVEERPADARVLLVTHHGAPELSEAARRVQAEATAALTALLAREPGVDPDDRRVELSVEFMKQGMHGLAEWWAEHPGFPRQVLVDAVFGVVWPGLRGTLELER